MTTESSQEHIRQRLSLIQETELSISLLESGLAFLQRDRPYPPKPKHFSFMLLLTTGLERLMKVILCLHALETTGRFPPNGYLKGFSHNLVNLRDSILENCYTSEYLKRPLVRADYDFIKRDALFNQMLSLLSDFAMRDRYIHLDSIATPQNTREWPHLRWEELERETLPSDVYVKLIGEGKLDELKQHANHHLIVCLEKFIRALARLFGFAKLGSLARSNSVTVWEFMTLTDEQLGQNEYKV